MPFVIAFLIVVGIAGTVMKVRARYNDGDHSPQPVKKEKNHHAKV